MSASRIGPDNSSSVAWRRALLSSLDGAVRTEDLLGTRMGETTLAGALLRARDVLTDTERMLGGFGEKDGWDVAFADPPQLAQFDHEVLPSLVFAVEDLSRRGADLDSSPSASGPASAKRTFEPREVPATGSIGETWAGRVQLDTVAVAYPLSAVPRFDRPCLSLTGHSDKGERFQVQLESHIETLLRAIDSDGEVPNDKVDMAWHREWKVESRGDRVRFSHESWKADFEVDRAALAHALGVEPLPR